VPTTVSSNFGAILALIPGGGGGGSLASTLATGNTTGGNDVIFSAGDAIDAADTVGGPGTNFDIIGSDGSGGVFAGGDITITPGQGSGGGADGEVNIDGDMTVQGDLTIVGSISFSNLLSGAGSPEGAVVGNIGAIYQRTDGSSGNSVYFKSAASGVNTGWVPAGPSVLDEFTAVGSAVFTTARDFFTSAPLSIELFVTWNGVRQREGVADDYQITGTNEITFNSTPPPGDVIAIEYLPS
jgi:hypothetical protein